MADSLYELLAPRIASSSTLPKSTVAEYLTRLTTLPVSALSTTEPQSISQSAHSNLLSIQALSSRSHKSVTTSADSLSTLRGSLPEIQKCVDGLRDAIPRLDEHASRFATTYSKLKDENAVLDRRKKAMLFSDELLRLHDILELPTLLQVTIRSTSSGSGHASYSQALDVFGLIKRLRTLYPDSEVVRDVLAEAEGAMRDMTSNLITSLRGQNLRLAAAIRTIGWLRRVAPQLQIQPPPKPSATATATAPASSGVGHANVSAKEDLFGALFLTARLANLLTSLDALSPLRELADQETAKRISEAATSPSTGKERNPSVAAGYVSPGQQTERYLKRFIEIFREQSFAMISMFRHIFPPASSEAEGQSRGNGGTGDGVTNDERPSTSSLLQPPSALATLPLHLVEILVETLQTYLPNVVDPVSRESLLMQVLYAAGSLGRLGADFSMMIALLFDDDGGGGGCGEVEVEAEVASGDAAAAAPSKPEWARIIEKHRVQATRLEALASGQDVGSGRRASSDVVVA